MADVELILERLAEMRARRAVWEPLWQDVFDYVLPFHAAVEGQRTPESRGEKRFDATATRMLRRLAATVSGLLASPNEDWLALVGERRTATGWQPVADEATLHWLDATLEPLMDALQRSNFYSEFPCLIEEMAGPGIGALYIEEKPFREEGFQGLRFRALGAGEFFIDEDDLGAIDTFMRCFKLTARQIRRKFPAADLHENIEQALAQNDGAASFEVVHAVYRRDDALLGEKTNPANRTGRAMPWASVYIDKSHERQIDIGGYRRQRYFTGRWSRAAGELYGRSPTIDALPDIKSLSSIARYGLEGLAMQVYPPWLLPEESIIGRLKLTPGAVNFYDAEASGRIESLTHKGSFQVEQAKEEAIRASIAQAYLDDILGLREGGDITATEVLDRRERRLQIAGTTATRIISDVLEPCVETAWLMMFDAGEFGAPPQGIAEVERLRPVFQSPLARQQRMGSTRALQDTVALLQPLMEAVPAMADHIDFDAIARAVPEDIGVPRAWIRDEEDVAATRRRRAEQEARDAQMAQALQVAELRKTDSEAEARRNHAA
jgi:hypothetical protein